MSTNEGLHNLHTPNTAKSRRMDKEQVTFTLPISRPGNGTSADVTNRLFVALSLFEQMTEENEINAALAYLCSRYDFSVKVD